MLALWGYTFRVMSMDRNFLLSPINIQLDTPGRHSFTVSSIGTGAIFSPPAVMISSVIVTSSISHYTLKGDAIIKLPLLQIFSDHNIPIYLALLFASLFPNTYNLSLPISFFPHISSPSLCCSLISFPHI